MKIRLAIIVAFILSIFSFSNFDCKEKVEGNLLHYGAENHASHAQYFSNTDSLFGLFDEVDPITNFSNILSLSKRGENRRNSSNDKFLVKFHNPITVIGYRYAKCSSNTILGYKPKSAISILLHQFRI
ncbi:MAG: hypothetical protein R3Y50_06485 [Rikenellaceae bacterium]